MLITWLLLRETFLFTNSIVSVATLHISKKCNSGTGINCIFFPFNESSDYWTAADGNYIQLLSIPALHFFGVASVNLSIPKNTVPSDCNVRLSWFLPRRGDEGNGLMNQPTDRQKNCNSKLWFQGNKITQQLSNFLNAFLISLFISDSWKGGSI